MPGAYKNPNRLVIAIFGPTAIGKTAVAIATANRLRDKGAEAVAISADALQVYEGLELLTAAATTAEQEQLEHRLIGIRPLDESFSAGEYARLAHQEVDSALSRDVWPIVVGGTGLYLRAALADLELRPKVPPEVRARWDNLLASEGAQELHRLLRSRDSALAERIPSQDAHRLIRAHELLDIGATPTINSASSQLWTDQTRHPTRLFGLTMERELLDARIDARVDRMIDAGVRDEVQRAAAAETSVTARKAIGFKELLAGDIEGFKTATRRYARRQLTWMRKLPNARIFDVTTRTPEQIAIEIESDL